MFAVALNIINLLTDEVVDKLFFNKNLESFQTGNT